MQVTHTRVIVVYYRHQSCMMRRADVSQLIVLASRQFNSGDQAWGFPLVRDLADIISRVFPEASLERAQEIQREVGMTCDV